MTVFFLMIAIFITLAGAAFCAGAETAFLSVSRGRIVHLARAGGRKAKIVEKALSDMGRTTTTLLIGNNLASVAYSSSSAALSSVLFSDNMTASAVWSLVAAFLVLYFSEFMPKLTCAARPLRRILQMAPGYRWLDRTLDPLTRLAIRFTNLFVPGRLERTRLTSADILRILQDRKDGVCLTDFESALISRIIVLRQKGEPITSEALLSCLRDADSC